MTLKISIIIRDKIGEKRIHLREIISTIFQLLRKNADFFTDRIDRRRDWTAAGRVSSFVSIKLSTVKRNEKLSG